MHSHPPPSTTRAFALATLVNLAYTVVEAGYGFATDSLALLSDALHNLGDVLGLALAWGAAALARRPPTSRHTYGWGRATLLSPLANAILLVAFSGALAWEAIRRFDAPPQVPAMPVIVVAAIGIVINLGAAWLLRDGHADDLNKRGAFLHLVADAAISLAAVLAGIGMLTLGWSWLDPATGLLVGIVVAFGSFRLLRDAFDAVMDAVPPSMDQSEVKAFLELQEGVSSVHHLHIWALAAGDIAMTAHLVCTDTHAPDDHDRFLDRLQHQLAERFGINHPTLQIEYGTQCHRDTHEPGASATGHGGHAHTHGHSH